MTAALEARFRETPFQDPTGAKCIVFGEVTRHVRSNLLFPARHQPKHKRKTFPGLRVIGVRQDRIGDLDERLNIKGAIYPYSGDDVIRWKESKLTSPTEEIVRQIAAQARGFALNEFPAVTD